MELLTHFITAPEIQQSKHSKRHQQARNNNSKANQIRNQISQIISQMPSYQICTKAALNAGISLNLLYFDKILIKIKDIQSISMLNQTLIQLKNLRRQVHKLREKSHKHQLSLFNQSKQHGTKHKTSKGKYRSSRISYLEEQKLVQYFEEERKKAIEEQMAFRIKTKKFYSTEKIEKKEQCFKRAAQRARQRNKRVLKIFKNSKERQDKSYKHAKSQKIHTPLMRKSTQEKKLSMLFLRKSQEQEEEEQKSVSDSFEPIQIIVDQQAPERSNQRCKTAIGGRTSQQKINAFIENKKIQNQHKYANIHRRQIQTRERKRQIVQKEEENAIKKLVDKQNRWIQRAKTGKVRPMKNSTIEQSPEPQEKKTKDRKFINLQSSIQDKCEEKILKKQIHLQQKINKIREDFKIKGERMEKHKQKKEFQHQFQIERNNLYMKNYKGKLKQNKEKKEIMHEESIKDRVLERKKQIKSHKIFEKVTKLSDQVLQKQYKKIKEKELMKSLKNIFFCYVK